MKTWFHNWQQKRAQKQKPPRTTRPELECLEAREVPTVTYHGGAVLANVEVQALYYGSDWSSKTLSGQRLQMDSYLSYLVQSPYMSMLHNAGYRVGSGSFSPGVWDKINLTPKISITDGQLQQDLQNLISRGVLQAPDGNRLYVVFVQDDVPVRRGNGSTNQANFQGYHSAFLDTYSYPGYHDIHYVVIPYPRGIVGNAAASWLSDFDNLTFVAARELADAVTDPDLHYKTSGFLDDALVNLDGTMGAEVGAITNLQTVYLNGNAVQRIADPNDRPMTPWGAGAARPVNFTLVEGLKLYEQSSSGWSLVATNVWSVSDQGIDNRGQAMVDYITTGGYAYEFHDGSSAPVFLASGVNQAKAGQGVSYLLSNSGDVREFRDATGSLSFPITFQYDRNGLIYISDGLAWSIDAGTDKFGVNAVYAVYISYYSTYAGDWDAAMVSDTDGWHFLGSNISQVSGGQMGNAICLDPWGNASTYNQWLGDRGILLPGGQVQRQSGLTFLAGGVFQVTAGSDQTGNIVFGIVYNDGRAWEYRPAANLNQLWTLLTYSVAALSKERLGLVDVLFTNGWTEARDSSGWHALSDGGIAVA